MKYLPLLLIALVWEIASRIGLVNPVFFSSPTGVAVAMYEWFSSGRIYVHLGWTVLEIVVGLFISLAIGVPLGLALGWYRPLADAANPVLNFLDAVPIIGVAPAVPLVVGLGPWTAIVLVVFLTILPTVLSVAAGVRTVPPELLRMGRHFGARDRQLFATIVLPAVAPYVFGAMRGNIARALAGALVGEWVGAKAGLGSMMFDAAGVFEVKGVFVGALTVVVLSLVLAALVGALERRTARWRPAPA